jgi:penicillin-binding protein 2
VLRYEKQYPARGNIYDRNGKLLVYNEALYDLMVIPGQVKNIDTAAFCELLGIDSSDFADAMNKAKKYSYYKPSIFLKQISKEDFGVIQEKLYQFSGFYPSTRTLRKYPMPIAAHLLGDVGEVSGTDIEKDPYYQAGDYIGKSGIEKYYEQQLRGIKGMKVLEVDVHNRVKGSYQNGKYDTIAVPGNDLVLSIEADLQLYGEQLMQNKKGSIVAIDPKTGEILALVSSPGFDPNMLVGRKRSENFDLLLHDTLKPLLNRAVMGTYPPGSTFKMINALIALQEGAVTPNTSFTCQGKSSRPIRCTHDHKSPLQLKHAIQESCNPYFWNTFKQILNAPKYNDPKKGYEQWYRSIRSFGFGEKFNTDIPYELSGNIPTVAYYDKVYKGSWNALTVRSLSIGQGEILVTPIQLANLAAIIANKGHYYAPHFIKKIENTESNSATIANRINTSVDKKHFNIATDAMLQVFEGEHGTARYYKLDSIQQCGKTGTVQNPHGEDHSMFIAFAPLESPKIAIAVIVENSGYGSTWAAPIASLLMEKYLTGKVKRTFYEKKMLEGDLIHNENHQP